MLHTFNELAKIGLIIMVAFLKDWYNLPIMKRYLPVFLSILALGAVIVGVTLWLRMFYQSVANYASPVAGLDLPEQSLELPDRTRVVLVLVGGLGNDVFDPVIFPGLRQLAQTGAVAVVYNNPPTYSHTSWLSLLTGATSELNGAPPFDQPASALTPVSIDTLFSRARAANLKSALFGPADWQDLLPPEPVTETFFVNPASPEADQLVFENAMLAINEPEIELLLIHFSGLDFAARHQGGITGSAWQQAAGQLDSHLLQLAQAIDFGRDALVIVSDHGYTEAGRLGGSEPELVWQPLVMVGKNISPGRYSEIDQTDIAPTVATLLALPAPAATQGRILFETLRLEKPDQTVAQLALARQRIALVEAYVLQVTGRPVAQDLPADLSRAQAAFVQGNIDGAFQLAQLTRQTADTLLAVTRAGAIRGGQWLRLLLAGALVLGWGMVMWRLRGPYAGAIIIAAIVTVGLYHILYQLQGYTYSISAIDDFSAWPLTVGRRMMVSFLAGGSLILIVLMLVVEVDWLNALGVGYGFGVLVTFVFSLPLGWAFWQNGLLVTWFLPDIDMMFWQITASIETVIAAMVGLFLPWPIMAVILLLTLTRRTLDKSRPGPDALPGLHLSK
jgi:hypothetical protein